MTEKLKGIWRCSHCGNLESREREVLCWECGKGQMLFYSADDLCRVFNSSNVIPLPVRDTTFDDHPLET